MSDFQQHHISSQQCPHLTSFRHIRPQQRRLLLPNLNIFPVSLYSVCPAEELPFEDGSVDFITAFTAAHWFDMPRFMKEVDRVLRPHGCVALSTYTTDFSMHYKDCSERLMEILTEVGEENNPLLKKKTLHMAGSVQYILRLPDTFQYKTLFSAVYNFART